MSRCAALEPRLHRYRDGELRGLARWRVERHVAACLHCQRELAELDALSALVREAELAGPAPDLWASIAAELPALDTRRRAHLQDAEGRRGRRWWAPVGAGAAVAALVIAVVLVVAERRPEAMSAGVVRSLYAPTGSVAVLERPNASTIIWVTGHESGTRTEGGHLGVG